MQYRAVNELLQKGKRSAGSSVGTYIHKEDKQNQWGKLNYIIDAEVRTNDLVTRWKDADSHTVNDVFNYCPMVLNYLSLKGFNKVLFVGHFNAAQASWTYPRKSDRNLHPTPTFKSADTTMVDPNIWIQFLPIVKMAMGYRDFQMHTAKPPESRFTQLMHSLYKRYEIDLVPASEQYKHGGNVTITPPHNTMYDAVVFAGVPKTGEDEGFTEHHIRSTFSPICCEGFEIIDINYQDKDHDKYIGGVRENNSDWLNEVFVSRTIWDDRFREESEADRNIEYSILDTMIDCHKTPGGITYPPGYDFE
tara:strand:+ start:447 stop:1361 length:915 start_codon:yes stop_codon:yes gene_type:complete